MTRNKLLAPATADPLPAVASLLLYRQIKDYINRGIQAGNWAVGARLPSEHALMQQFAVSRMTVNRALRELAAEGRITRMAGVGSFVAEEKVQSTLLQIANIATEIRDRGHDYEREVISVERRLAPTDVAALLNLGIGESVFHVLCVHSENGAPVQLEERYVNPRAAPAFGDQDFSAEGPSEYLVRTVPFDQVEHVVDAVMPDDEQSTLLRMPPTQPCLLLTRRTWYHGVAITLVRCLHPASRFRLGSRFSTSGNASVSTG